MASVASTIRGGNPTSSTNRRTPSLGMRNSPANASAKLSRGPSAAGHDTVRLVAVEQSVGEFVGRRETAPPGRHVQVDEDRESDIGMVQEGSRGCLTEVRTEGRPVDGDPQQFAHGVEVHGSARCQGLRASGLPPPCGGCRPFWTNFARCTKGLWVRPRMGVLTRAASSAYRSRKPTNSRMPGAAPGSTFSSARISIPARVDACWLYVASLRQVGGGHAEEPGQSAQLAVVRSP